MTSTLNRVSQPRSRPMFNVRAVVSLLDVSEDAVIRLVECGDLLWAFNVASRTDTAREIRILPACVAGYMEKIPFQADWGEVWRLLFPGSGREITAKEIYRALNISSMHLYGLAKQGLIGPCSGWRRGIYGQGRFESAAVAQFLKARRVE